MLAIGSAVATRRDIHFPPKPGDESPGYVHRPLSRTSLAAIAAIERRPALQRGFENAKSKPRRVATLECLQKARF